MNNRQKGFTANSSKGFTLIELLVVIAIIGILAALVLVALGNARDKANDARIKSNLGQLRTLAEVHYDSAGGSYATLGTCFEGTLADCEGDIDDSVSSLRSDTTSAGGAINATSAATTFCVESDLASSATTYVCVDQTGEFVSDNTASSCTAAASQC